MPDRTTPVSSYPTFLEVAAMERKDAPPYVDFQTEGMRCLVRRGGASFTAYLGVPDSHPLAGFDYEALPLEVHGGLTFAGRFKDVPGWYFYGWDFAHLGDRSFYDVRYGDDAEEHAWEVAEVEQNARETLWDFKKLARLAEEVKNRG